MVKTSAQIKKMKVAGKILASVLKALRQAVQPGVTLIELDHLARTLIEDAGGMATFLGYQPYGATQPFPAAICASLNDVVVHGVPDDRAVRDGDILKIDCGVTYEGMIADAAFSMGVGTITPEAEKLMRVTKHALLLGIKECRLGKTVGDIGWAISKYVRAQGLFVVKGLTGHGVGKELHEEPTIFNEGKKGVGLKLKTGMTLALEPMVSIGDPRVHQLEDDSYATNDGSLSAHFEHTVLITDKGPEVLTE